MTINKVLKWVIYVGIFILPFFIFFISNSLYFPFIAGKNFAFRIIVEVILASWLILALRDVDYRPKKTWIFWSVLGFMLVAILATVFGEAPYRSFWSNYERMDGLVNLLHAGAYFLVVASVMTKKIWHWWMKTSMSASVIMGIYVIFQILGKIPSHQGAGRVDGTFGNPTYFAVYALFHIFFALYFLMPTIMAGETKRKIWPVIFYSIVVVLNVIGLYNTATRGTILGFIGGLILMALLYSVLGKGTLRKISVSALVLLAVLIGGFFAAKDSQFVTESPVLKRFANISMDDNTTKARFIIWGMGLEGFKEHPILGWGPENFNLVFNKYYEPSLYAQEQWFDRSHNIFVDWLVQGGILGLLAYISLFASVLYVIWRRRSDFTVEEKAVLTGLLAAYVFQNLFVFDNLYSYIMFFSVLAYAHVRSYPISETHPRVWGNTKVNEIVAHSFASIVIVALVFSIYFVNIKPVRAGQFIIDALGPKEGTVEASINYFNKAISLGTFGSKEAREQLLNQALRVARDNFPVEDKQKIVELAKTEMDKEIEHSPKDARGYVLLGSSLRSVGAASEAMPYLEKAKELSPQKQTIIFELGIAYLVLKDYERGTLLLKEAFESAPEFDTARILYASALIYSGKTADGEALLQEKFGGIPADANIINAYVASKNFSKVIKIWQDKVESEPNVPAYHLSLAAAYLANSEPQKAIAEIRKAMELDPKLTPQGEQYIKDIQAGKQMI